MILIDLNSIIIMKINNNSNNYMMINMTNIKIKKILNKTLTIIIISINIFSKKLWIIKVIIIKIRVKQV